MSSPPVMHSERSRWLQTLDDLYFEQNQEALAREAERQKRRPLEQPNPESES